MVAAANGIARNRRTRFPLRVTYERDARHRAVSRHLENILERSTSLHASPSCVSLTPLLPLLYIYMYVCVCMCVCVSASLTAVRTYADLEPRTTRVNRFAHYKLLTPETLHDEECETIFSVKSKRQVERKKERKKEGDIVRKKHLEAPFLISFPLDPFDGMEEDRPGPLRSDYLSLSFSFSLSLSLIESISDHTALSRVSLNYRTVTFYHLRNREPRID